MLISGFTLSSSVDSWEIPAQWPALMTPEGIGGAVHQMNWDMTTKQSTDVYPMFAQIQLGRPLGPQQAGQSIHVQGFSWGSSGAIKVQFRRNR